MLPHSSSTVGGESCKMWIQCSTIASVVCTVEGSKFDNLAIVWTMKELATLVAALSFLMIFMQTILFVSKSKHCT